SLGWTLLVLLAAVMHAGWNVLVKFGNDALVNMTLIMTMAGLIALCFVPFVNFPDPASWIFLFGSLATHVGYYVFLLLGYRYGNLSLVYPTARGSAPLLVAVSSWLFVGEALSPLEMAGVASISAGILSLMVDRAGDARHNWRAVTFGLLTGLSIMGYTLCDGQGVRVAGDKWGYIVWLFVLDAPALVIICLCLRGQKLFTLAARHWRVGAIGGALSMAAYGIAIYAMSQAFMAQVAALRETSVIFAAIFSAYILKERFHPRRYASVGLVALGAVLLH
ncbi:MAG TPA: EamA family transporter, partial [Dongiaceae bacterium]|nr:EamA family transporter [Dongiaceae bacterium]